MSGNWRSSLREFAIGWAERHWSLVQALVDTGVWAIALTFATVVRWNFEVGRIDLGGLFAIIPLAGLAQMVAGLASGLYTRRWRFGSSEEVAALARAAGITTALLFLLDVWAISGARMVPVSAVIAGGVVAFALMGGVRYTWRLERERRRRPTGENAIRLIVLGAGEGGGQVI